MLDRAGEPMKVAMASWLTAGVEGPARVMALLSPVLETLAGVAGNEPGSARRLGITVALPPARPGRPTDLEERVLTTIAGMFGRSTLRYSHCLPGGHASGYEGMVWACDELAAGRIDACIVAGADTYLSAATMDWLEAREQLHGAGPDNNAWGFVPGEGAGGLLLVAPRTERRTSTLGDLVSIGIGHETCVIKSDSVALGRGLTSAFREALRPVPSGVRISRVFCDLNGEPYRADEYGFTMLRTGDRFDDPSQFVASADCWGDVGAASAPLHLAQALAEMTRRGGPGDCALAWASSEGGQRGAAVVRAAV